MSKIKKPGSPSEVPKPDRDPEIRPNTIPEKPVLPEEEPEILPEEEPEVLPEKGPDDPSPAEIPAPQK